MKSNQEAVKKDTALRAALVTTAVCAALLAARGLHAQEAVENAKAAAIPIPHGPVQMTISMNPAPAQPANTMQSAAARGPACTRTQSEQSTVVVPVGKSTLMQTAEPVRNRTLGNPLVAQATMVSPQTLYVVGMAVGTTNMIVQGKSGACEVINVVVNADSGGLQTSLSQLMPDEPNIRVSTVAGDLVLAGRVSSAQAAAQAQEIAKAYARSTLPAANGGTNGNGGAPAKAATVLNMMSVDSPQQVMLEVKVAEVSKTVLNQLGSAMNIQGGFGSWSGALISSLLSGVQSIAAVSKANNRPFNVAVDGQHGDDLVKILAEPNLVTLSGQEATFLAGGKVFIPIPQSNLNGVSTIILQEEEFGVGLKFTPTVLAGGRINLKVAPEVSELSSTGVTVGATNTNNLTVLPLITTRRASTTVQMNDGETFAIGGLIKSNAAGTLKAIPGVGEVPVLGALFRSTSYQQDRTELIFIITPHLVKPLQAVANLPLPTDRLKTPNEADVYLLGNMEGRDPAGSRKPAPPMPAPTPSPAMAPAPSQPQAPAAQPASEPPVSAMVPTPAAIATPLPEPQVSTPAEDSKPAYEAAAHAAQVEANAAQIAARETLPADKPRSPSARAHN
ncbi:Type 3 secretion system secretin [Paraburkholderia phenoliruptrix]|uniref:Type 3 secretion system secretin n=1 Tax=Paraburkholderia phenoliruptrix TaxID=252970 RepID=A0A6J5C5H7_9BURK|nr:type II and III secretion system protein family protein [Paraburkholderia phenoliruptrix]CAB3726759.1 Type 3 secretion system secretin [Paraburkholderia phenoliruptrix]